MKAIPKPNTLKTATVNKKRDKQKQSRLDEGEQKNSNSSNSMLSLNGPTILTILRILLSILLMFFIFLPDTWARIIALVIFVVASLTDLIDGKWARRSKIVTDLGAFFDPLADKILINLTLLALTSLNIIPFWVFAIILVRDFTVDGLRMAIAKKGKTLPASFCGKLKTTSQMITLVIFLLNLIVNLEMLMVIGRIFLYFSLVLTVFSGINYLAKGINYLKNY